MTDYRVNLEIYNGPLDLLLYLIRRDEVDVYDIPISRITEQYVQYVEVLQGLDPNLAGDFLVMAATLMEIKTRLLLPSAPPEEGGSGDEEGIGLDPRTELVRQLLQYKAFKDAADDLRQAGEHQSMRFPRRPSLELPDEPEVELDDVQIWDLVDAFGRLMSSIGHTPRQHEVIYDDTPLELHQDDIMDRLGREGRLTFTKIFEGRTRRTEIVGLFLAVLELVRQKRIRAAQDENFGQIVIEPKTAEEVEAELSGQHKKDAGGPDIASRRFRKNPFAQDAAAASDAPAGQYVSDQPPADDERPDEDWPEDPDADEVPEEDPDDRDGRDDEDGDLLDELDLDDEGDDPDEDEDDLTDEDILEEEEEFEDDDEEDFDDEDEDDDEDLDEDEDDQDEPEQAP